MGTSRSVCERAGLGEDSLFLGRWLRSGLLGSRVHGGGARIGGIQGLLVPSVGTLVPRLSEHPNVAVWLHSVGKPLCTKLSEWDSWLSSDPGFSSKLLQESWKAAAEELSKISTESLIQGVDRDALLRDRKKKLTSF